MKKYSAIALVLIVVVAVGAVAQSKEAVIAKARQAQGADAFENINSMVMEMSGTMMGSMEMSMKMQMIRPDKIRNDITAMGMNIIQATDGTDYWMSQMGQVMDMDENTKKQFGNSMAQFTGSVEALEDMGATLTYAGTETVDGVQAEVLDMEMAEENMSGKMYFSSETGLPFQITMNMPMGEMVMKLQEYQEINGMKFPQKITAVMGGTPMMELSITNVEINPTIDPSIFARP